MRVAAAAEMVRLAKGSGPIGELVSQSVNRGDMDPITLREKLEEGGYKISYEDGKAGFYVNVTKDGELIAYGYSNTKADALMQALYAKIKDEAKEIAAQAESVS